MKKVLILTNFKKWDDLSLSFSADPIWEDPYYQIKTDHLLKYYAAPGGTPGLKAVTSPAEEGIYLVYDDIPESKLAGWLDACQNDQVYVLAHRTRPSIPVGFFGKYRFCHPREGSHTGLPSDLYFPIFKILFDKGITDKFNSVIRVLYPLMQVVLCFLNECLAPGNSNPVFEEYYKEIMGEAPEDIRESLRKFYEVTYPKSTVFEDYEQELLQLQGELIAFAQ